MVTYTNEVQNRIKRKMSFIREHKDELKPTTMTIKIEKKNNMFTKATKVGDELSWYSNDTKEEYEGSKGTSPLAYFLSSLGLCQCVHYSEHSIVEGITLDSLTMEVEGVISQNPREFTAISYTVHIKSLESDETIKKLAKDSANDCYVTNTLKKACKITGTVMHNEKKIDDHTW